MVQIKITLCGANNTHLPESSLNCPKTVFETFADTYCILRFSPHTTPKIKMPFLETPQKMQHNFQVVIGPKIISCLLYSQRDFHFHWSAKTALLATRVSTTKKPKYSSKNALKNSYGFFWDEALLCTGYTNFDSCAFMFIFRCISFYWVTPLLMIWNIYLWNIEPLHTCFFFLCRVCQTFLSQFKSHYNYFNKCVTFANFYR